MPLSDKIEEFFDKCSEQDPEGWKHLFIIIGIGALEYVIKHPWNIGAGIIMFLLAVHRLKRSKIKTEILRQKSLTEVANREIMERSLDRMRKNDEKEGLTTDDINNEQ